LFFGRMTLSALRLTGWLALGAAGLATLNAADPAPQVIVVSDVSKAGRDARVPDKDHPVYYVVLTPDQPKTAPAEPAPGAPTRSAVLTEFATALARRHYLPAEPGHPPELVLSCWWGTADPQLENFGTDDALEETSFAERDMDALVGSSKKQELMSWHSKDLRAAMREERHYLIVMAFDYAAAVQKQKKILWITRTSTPSASIDLRGAIAALVLTAEPAFGREAAPSWIDSGKVRQGTVTVAPFEVKETVPEKK
jgi:hypothetical protein